MFLWYLSSTQWKCVSVTPINLKWILNTYSDLFNISIFLSLCTSVLVKDKLSWPELHHCQFEENNKYLCSWGVWYIFFLHGCWLFQVPSQKSSKCALLLVKIYKVGAHQFWFQHPNMVQIKKGIRSSCTS